MHISCLYVGNLLSGKLLAEQSDESDTADENETYHQLLESDTEQSADELETQKYHQGDIHKDEATAGIIIASLKEDIEKGKAAKQQIGKCVLARQQFDVKFAL